MSNLTKENLIEAGGNLWEKGSISRVYLNNDTIAKAFSLVMDDRAAYKGQFKSIGKARVWFDCKNGTLHSDKGMVRVMFNQNDVDCKK